MIARQAMSIEFSGVIFLFLAGLLASAGWQWPFLLYLSAWILLAMVLLFIPQPAAKMPFPPGDTPTARLSPALKVVFTAACISMTVFFTCMIILPEHLHELGLDEAQTGYFLSFTSLVAVGAAALLPRVTRRAGEHGTLISAFSFYALALALFASASELPAMIAGNIFLGIGFGLSIPLVNHMTIELSHIQHRGRNLAYISMAIFAGQFLSSFMTFLPGSRALTFAAAGAIAGGTAGLLWLVHRRIRNRAQS
jgi:predicted MFS family arabinose efflux permease